MRVAIYTRVSTDEQTTENQKLELLKVIEHRQGTGPKIFEDQGISGAKGRDKRPALDEMLKSCLRGEFDIVAAWSVDRLGRSLSDLVALLNELHAANVGLYLHQQAIDTTTPSGRAMYQMIGVFAEFERSMIQERGKAGLRRAVAQGQRLGAAPKIEEDDRRTIRFALELGESAQNLADRYGVSRMTIYRIRKELT